MVALSVMTSQTASSGAMTSPTETFHLTSSASVTPSPTSGNSKVYDIDVIPCDRGIKVDLIVRLGL